MQKQLQHNNYSCTLALLNNCLRVWLFVARTTLLVVNDCQLMILGSSDSMYAIKAFTVIHTTYFWFIWVNNLSDSDAA